MKVCIVSDSHDNRKLLDVAVEDAKKAGVEAVLHCGDVVAPTTLRVLQKHGLPVHVIHGNNTGDLFNMAQLSNEPESVVNFYGQDAGIELAGKRIFLVHYP
ncbi:metallophosphoesterase family protein, partial [Kaarinaea lacus]